jgi:hypothetical protein
MAFDVSVASGVENYIRQREGLTVSDQDRIIAGLVEELGESADEFHRRNQFPRNPTLYWCNYILMTDAHEVRAFRFTCNENGHVVGVTEVHFVEEYGADQD